MIKHKYTVTAFLARGGEKCSSFEECLIVIGTEADGPSMPFSRAYFDWPVELGDLFEERITLHKLKPRKLAGPYKEKS